MNIVQHRSQATQESAEALIQRAPSKISRILAYLLHVGSLNRFEAERIGDHCLHSTISSLANIHGLSFLRRQEKAPSAWGPHCDVTRYALPESEHQKASAVLASLYGKCRLKEEVAA